MYIQFAMLSQYVDILCHALTIRRYTLSCSNNMIFFLFMYDKEVCVCNKRGCFKYHYWCSVNPFRFEPLLRAKAGPAVPFQTPQNAVSGQSLHCLFTGTFMQNEIKMEIVTENPYN